EPRQLEPRAMIVLRIEVACPLPGCDRPLAVAQIVADRTKRKPSRGERGREFDGVHQYRGGAGEIAARNPLERRSVALIGRSIAGWDEQRSICHCAVSRIISGRCAPRPCCCRRPPECAASPAASISTPPVRSTRP